MTVSELILELSKYDKNLPVMINEVMGAVKLEGVAMQKLKSVTIHNGTFISNNEGTEHQYVIWEEEYFVNFKTKGYAKKVVVITGTSLKEKENNI